MRTHAHELQGFLELPTLRDAATRRGSFRQALTTIARAAAVEGPSPLEGVPVDALGKAVKVALEAGLFDDLEWLSPGAVGVALYELAGALPTGSEQRELGRRLLARVHEAPAEGFAAIATRMALGSRKGLSGAAMRTRLSLLFAARGVTVDAGPLAFALVSRRELAREWIAAPSTGSLPGRRLAARILERAAVVAARRASQGDDYAPRVFSTEAVAGAFARLLSDREPLVWRHAAAARGVLAGVAAPHWKATVEGLHPRLSPTEWRRGAVSIAAAIGTAPERALPRALDLVSGPLATADRGLVATMAWGLPRALETEPEAAERLLDAIVAVDAAGCAEALVAIVREVGGDAGRRGIDRARALLTERLASARDDDGESAVTRTLLAELAPDPTADGSIREAVGRALTAWIERGSRDAFTLASEAADVARAAISTLESFDAKGSRDARARRTESLLLHDLDTALIEDSALADLLRLRPPNALRASSTGPRRADEALAMPPMEELHDRLGRWLVTMERTEPPQGASGTVPSGRRLRALLRLLDGEVWRAEEGDESPRAQRIRLRRIEALSVLLGRLVGDRRSPLHRTICAALARGLDALVRDATCDPVDVLLVAAARLDDAADLDMLAEASMNPDVGATLAAYAKFVRAGTIEEPLLLTVPSTRESDGVSIPPSATIDERGLAPITAKLEALLELSAALGDDVSGRAETLRAVFVRTARALRHLEASTARKALIEAGGGIESLAAAVQFYAQMEQGARTRVLGEETSAAVAGSGARIAGCLARLGDRSDDVAQSGVDDAIVEIARLLPTPLRRLVVEVLQRAVGRPFEALEPQASAAKLKVAESLPAWLGARRTIGGFYVVRPLGGGAASSVFVAKRIEERHDPRAEQFALKVPDYDGAAARSLSEQEFLALFRAEASALLGLPPSPNLARFVTFDLAARPKPILVMELISGPTLERFVDGATGKAKATTGRALEILDGILAGLEWMHEHAVGHLDVKPSNVILREGLTPTLVDFGLAGRQIRPGCATGPYGAPEVWGVLPEDFSGAPLPMPADVYAFGAVAYEVLTGDTLFGAQSETAIITQHLTHDGHPPGLDRLRRVQPMMELLEQSLRHDPRARWTVRQLRSGLRALTPHVKDLPWPLG